MQGGRGGRGRQRLPAKATYPCLCCGGDLAGGACLTAPPTLRTFHHHPPLHHAQALESFVYGMNTDDLPNYRLPVSDLDFHPGLVFVKVRWQHETRV